MIVPEKIDSISRAALRAGLDPALPLPAGAELVSLDSPAGNWGRIPAGACEVLGKLAVGGQVPAEMDASARRDYGRAPVVYVWPCGRIYKDPFGAFVIEPAGLRAGVRYY